MLSNDDLDLLPTHPPIRGKISRAWRCGCASRKHKAAMKRQAHHRHRRAIRAALRGASTKDIPKSFGPWDIY